MKGRPPDVLPKNLEELIEYSVQLIERVSTTIATTGRPFPGMVCPWCKERISTFAWSHGHRGRCPKNPRAVKELERLARIAKYTAKR